MNPVPAAESAQFRRDIEPLLKKYCYACHANGAKSGNIAFDGFKSDDALSQDRKLFRRVLENVRSGTMPPAQMPQPTPAEKARLGEWIKARVFRIDRNHPDPGRVTVRRLNRAEYRNTVRDLLGVDYDTQTEFPPDDAGHGFDNMGDVLTISPMLMEKYLDAAQAIISQAVPTTAKVVAEKEIPGASFRREGATPAVDDGNAFRALSYYEPAIVSNAVQAEFAGDYKLVLDLSAHERYVDNQFDYNKCRLIVRSDGHELLRRDFNREGGKRLRFEFDQKWSMGAHTLTFEVQPLTPGAAQIRALTLRINKVIVRGPFDDKNLVEPRNYRTFFPRPVPASASDRRRYARELLGKFARRAFRRPVDENTLDRLTALAQSVYSQPNQSFEAGIAQAMVATLASPRFLFREEGVTAANEARPYAPIDEYALASRLSYFLWSSMPDDELFRLAESGQLRTNLAAQVQRMLRDRRCDALIQNFSGQWLQTRDIEKVSINARAVMSRETEPVGNGAAGNVSPGDNNRRGAGRPRVVFDDPLRKSLKREADLYFGHVVQNNRSVLELLDSNYTFLNARLAQFYGAADSGPNSGFVGDEFRLVTLPPGSSRGGVLTLGSVLAVTSNPTRTSPVKRGQFILNNILGAPAPPPPPNIPALEDAAAHAASRKPTLREVLALHRSKPECVSCHQRLDPPGLALENFNALGLWRERELGQPVEPAGTLATGESFKDIRELKQILVRRHRDEFYRCLTQKMLTYALGRGLEDNDIEAVDRVVTRLQQDDGRFLSLLMGIIESIPFQECRKSPSAGDTTANPGGQKPAPKPAKPPVRRSDASKTGTGKRTP